MTHRNPAAPYPEELFRFLRDAVGILDGAEPTKDQRDEIQGVIVLLDRLTQLMQKADPGFSYPMGSRRRIVEARDTLDTISLDHSGFASAKEVLKAVLRDWDDFWRDPEELEG